MELRRASSATVATWTAACQQQSNGRSSLAARFGRPSAPSWITNQSLAASCLAAGREREREISGLKSSKVGRRLVRRLNERTSSSKPAASLCASVVGQHTQLSLPVDWSPISDVLMLTMLSNVARSSNQLALVCEFALVLWLTAAASCGRCLLF